MKTNNEVPVHLAKVKIVDPDTGSIIGEKIIDLNSQDLIYPNTIIHKTLSVDLENRLQKIWKDVGPYVRYKNYKHFNKNMRMEMHIDREIFAWENIANIFTRWVQNENITNKNEKQEAFNFVMNWSLSGLTLDEFIALNSDLISHEVDSILNDPFTKN